MKNKNWRTLIFWIFGFILIVFFLNSLRSFQEVTEIAYSDFKRILRENKIVKIKIKKDILQGSYMDDKGEMVHFRTIAIPDPDLIKELEAYEVQQYSGAVERSWVTAILSNLVWILLFFGLWYFLIIKPMQGGGKQAMAFGRSRARLVGKKQKITFNDVAGCDEAKEELQEIIQFLKEPAKFQKLGGKIPKGVLIFGLPGTGKTLLAKAISGEASVPFFSSSGSEFVEMFVGVGASRVRDLFEQGRKNAPCLLFIDEIDAVGRHRFAGVGGGHDEREQTLNQLLVEMDGFDTKEGVILVAATNRPDVLDPALLRPGRFDRQIAVPTPDLNGREQILRIHARNVKFAKEADLSIIARRTPGFVGSDLANLINESALLAARRDKESVGMSELEEAIDRVIAGPERKSRMISDKEKRMIAIHEGGHTLVAKFTPDSDPIHKVSIIPRGPALGYTLQLPSEDRYLTTRTEILDKLCVLLGGRAAEELIFSELTTGAQSDLAKATEMVQKMVCEFGMSERLGPMTFRKREEELFLGRDLGRPRQYSEKTAQVIDEEVSRIIHEARKKAGDILKKNKDTLERIAENLVEREILTGDDIEEIVKGKELKPLVKENEKKDTEKKQETDKKTHEEQKKYPAQENQPQKT